MIMKKEEQIVVLQQQLHDLQTEYEKTCLETMALRADIDTLDAQLTTEREDHAANVTTRNKLVEERDELRILLATKASEETRRSEAQRSMELELAGLRSEASKLHQDLTNLKRSALENQNKAKLEFEQIMHDHSSLQSTHASLVERAEATQAQLNKVQAQLPELEKAKRTLESELLSSRSRLHEQEDHLAEALRMKGVSSSLFFILFSYLCISESGAAAGSSSRQVPQLRRCRHRITARKGHPFTGAAGGP